MTDIFIVEDEIIVAESIRVVLEKNGYNVCGVFSRGEKALEMAKKKSPDMVLMDIMLKGNLDGIETAKVFKENYNVPVVYLTAYADSEILKRIKISQPFGYLVKPFEDRELISTIEIASDLFGKSEKIKSLNSLLLSIRNINQLIVSVRDKQELIKKSVEYLYECRNYSHAWIMLTNNGDITNIYGEGDHIRFKNWESELENLNLPECIKRLNEEKDYLIMDVASDCLSCKLLSDQKSEHTSIVFQIKYNGMFYGYLSVALFTGDFSEEEEISLLKEVTGDIAYCLNNLKLIEKEKESLKLLAASEKKYKNLVENSLVGVYKADKSGRLVFGNSALATILGHDSVGELKSALLLEHYIDHEDREKILSLLNEHGQVQNYELRLKTKNDRKIFVLISASVAEGEISGMMLDISMIKEYEKRLKRNEEMYRLLTENSVDIVWKMDLRLKFLYLSPSLERVTGFKPDEWIGTHLWNHAKRKEFFKMARNALRTVKETKNYPFTLFETKLLKKDKSEVSVEIIGKPVINEKGNVIALQGTTRDITERIKNRQKIDEYYDFLDALLMAVPSPLFYKDEDLIYVGCNKAFCEYIGKTKEEIVGKTVNDLYAPDLAEVYNKSDSEMIKDGYDQVYETQVEYADRSRRDVIIYKSVYRVGESKGLIGVILDITKRKQTERALIESEERFKGIFNNTTAGLYRMSSDHNFIIVNPSLLDLLGFDDQDELLAEAFSDCYYPDKEERCHFWKILRDEGVVFGFETTIVNKYGDIIPIVESARIIHDVVNNIEIIEGSIEDHSEVVSARKKLEEAKSLAENTATLKSEFLAQMSHEIRTPLNAIINFSGLIKEEMKTGCAEIQDYFDIIDMESKRIIRTIDSILNMSELVSGTYEYRPVPIYLKGNIVESLVEDFSSEAKKKGVAFIFESDIGEVSINGDENGITLILYHLIDNAVKFTKKGFVKVSFYPKKDKIILEIEDTGCGISKEFLAKIYEPFSQEFTGYTRLYDGNGLGMAIVQQFCLLDNIEIDIKSEKNVGTKISLTIEGTIL